MLCAPLPTEVVVLESRTNTGVVFVENGTKSAEVVFVCLAISLPKRCHKTTKNKPNILSKTWLVSEIAGILSPVNC